MTIVADEVSVALQTVWPDAVAGTAVPMSGGFWATMFRVPVTGQPVGVADEVVVRFAPHRSMGAKEAEVQRVLAELGVPTPRVWASRPDEGRGGWCSVMDFSPGRPLLAGLDGIAALRKAPALLRTLPAQLAGAAATLHRVDPDPVTAAVRRVAPDVAWSALDLLGHLRAGAIAVDRPDVLAALDGLQRDAPELTRAVVCHGDLHPFNVLDRDGELVLLDWTGAVVADPCFDLAFTELLLANPPLVLPGPLAAIGRRVGRLLARRFLAAYARAQGQAGFDNLGWYRALHSARVLVELTNLRARHGPNAGGHPFALLEPAATKHLLLADDGSAPTR